MVSRFRQRAVLTGCVLAAVLAAAGLFVTDYGIDPDRLEELDLTPEGFDPPEPGTGSGHAFD